MSKDKTLKQANLSYLVAFTTFNAFLVAWLSLNAPISSSCLREAIKADYAKTSFFLLLCLVVIVLNSLPSREFKTRLVFWRNDWPEPGARAFTEHMFNDVRIDVDSLKEQLGEIPTDPREQNAAWYRLYQVHEAVPSVRQNHKEYLLFRDLTWLSAVGFCTGSMVLFLVYGPTTAFLLYFVSTSIAWFLIRFAAVGHGNRFIRTVLACAAADEEG